MFLSVFYRKLKNIYWKCHNHRRLHRRKHSVGILSRVEKYLLQMPYPLMFILTDTVHRYFTESWKIFTLYATITDEIFSSVYFQREIFFGAHFPSVKPSVFFSDRINDRMWNYWWTLCRWTASTRDLVSKKFTNEMTISHRWILFVDKTVKCYSEWRMHMCI
jgi:hypothetical protein